jgi:hypothetical protein
MLSAATLAAATTTRSFVLNFSSDGVDDKASFSHRFYPPLQSAAAAALGDEVGAEVAITLFSSYYCKKNVDKSNNKFYFDDDRMVELPEGTYSVHTLEEELKNLVGSDNILLAVQEPTGRLGIWCKYPVNFGKENSLGELLGFEKDSVLAPARVHIAPKTTNLHAAEAIYVKCHGAEGAIVNGEQSDVIFTIALNAEPQFKISATPTRAIYHRIKLSSISELRFTVVDDRGQCVSTDWKSPILLQAHLIVTGSSE